MDFSFQFSCLVVSDSLRPHGLQYARPPCPSPTPEVHLNPCPLSRWCHSAISSSLIPFSPHPQSLPASGSFQVSQLFTSGGQSIEVSASTSVLPMNTQDWSPLGWTGWISLQSKGLLRVFSVDFQWLPVTEQQQPSNQERGEKSTVSQSSLMELTLLTPGFHALVSRTVVQSLSHVRLFVTPWTAAQQVSLSFTISQSLLKLMSIESVIPSNHIILCCPFLLPSIFPSIRVFSNESALRIRCPKYWRFSFSISISTEYAELISFRIDWFGLLAVQEIPKSLLQHHCSKASILWYPAFFMVQLSHPYMTTRKTIALTRQTFVSKVMSLLFNTLSRFVIACELWENTLLLFQVTKVVIICSRNPRKLISLQLST